MPELSFAEKHIMGYLRAAMAEAGGELDKASRLRAQGKLRLVCMSDDELMELAELTSLESAKPVEIIYNDLQWTVTQYKNTSDEWLNRVTITPNEAFVTQ